MKPILFAVIAAVLCTGCATSFQPPTSDAQATSAPTLRFQRKLLDPRDGGILVTAEHLQPGDILLSAANGITSLGVRVMTVAPVSHASLYIGNQEIVEAVGQGVRKRKLKEALDEEAVVVVLRHPQLQPAHQAKIQQFALQKVGLPYDHLGIILQAPFSIERQLCELPLVPEVIRNACLHSIATIQLGLPSNDRFFCSQLVLESYRQAGIPLTAADPRWVSPADILHMRDGDVSSLRIHQSLNYVGHLKQMVPSALAQAE